MSWPIAQRGADMEDTIKQQRAADLLNLAQLKLAKEKSEKLIAAKAKKK